MDNAYILKPCDILAISNKSIPSKIIRGVTKQNYSHVSMVGRDELHVFEALFTGVRYREIRNKLGEFDVYRYEALTDLEAAKIISFCSKRINLGYDYIELSSYVFRGLKKFDNHSKYICSQLIYDAYESAGISLLKHHNIIVSPGDLVSSNKLTKIN